MSCYVHPNDPMGVRFRKQISDAQRPRHRWLRNMIKSISIESMPDKSLGCLGPLCRVQNPCWMMIICDYIIQHRAYHNPLWKIHGIRINQAVYSIKDDIGFSTLFTWYCQQRWLKMDILTVFHQVKWAWFCCRSNKLTYGTDPCSNLFRKPPYIYYIIWLTYPFLFGTQPHL